MANILPFVQARDAAFDEKATHIIGDAFDVACTLLGNMSDLEREAVADRIIEAAMCGERDPVRLRNTGDDCTKAASWVVTAS